jgi:hypothetical protein
MFFFFENVVGTLWEQQIPKKIKKRLQINF